MMERKSEVITVPISKLMPADWNPKAEGEEEEIAKLVASIEHDGSYGILAVRRVKQKFEVMDGNHRLEALKQIGLKEVEVEDFGKITKGQAAGIAHRRNAQWFDEDQVMFAQLLVNDIAPEFDSLADLALIMPENELTLENMVDMSSGLFDFKEGSPKDPDDENSRLSIKVDPETMQEWDQWKRRIAEFSDDDSDEEAFRILIGFGVRVDLNAEFPG